MLLPTPSANIHTPHSHRHSSSSRKAMGNNNNEEVEEEGEELAKEVQEGGR